MNLNAIRPIGPHILGFIRFASEGEGEELRQLPHLEVLSRVHQESQGNDSDAVVGKQKLAPHPIASVLAETLNNKPAGQIKEIPIRLMFNSPDNNLSARYEAFDTDLNRLVCAGNGENFNRASLINGETTTGSCAGPDLCGHANSGCVQCHLKVRLKVQISGQDDPFSAFEFQSGSINTYRTLSAKLQMMQAAFGDKLRYIPLTLMVWSKSSAESDYRPFYCADIALANQATPSTAMKQASEDAANDRDLGLNLDAMETSVTKMRTEGVLCLDSAEDTVITFTPNRLRAAPKRPAVLTNGNDFSSVISLARAAADIGAGAGAAGIAHVAEENTIAGPTGPALDSLSAPETSVTSTSETPPTPI